MSEDAMALLRDIDKLFFSGELILKRMLANDPMESANAKLEMMKLMSRLQGVLIRSDKSG